MGEALSKSKNNMRRKIAGLSIPLMYKIGLSKYAMKVHNLFLTKEELAEQKEVLDDLDKSMDETFKRYEKIVNENPALKPWVTKEKIANVPGRILIVQDAIIAWDGMLDIAKLEAFLNEFAQNQLVYQNLMVFLGTLTTRAVSAGFIKGDGSISKEDMPAFSNYYYHHLTELIVKGHEGKYRYEELRPYLEKEY